MRWTSSLCAGVVLVGGSVALGQVVQQPFFTGGVGAYAPQIGVVNSGAVLDAQAVVSHDRRYVTINARPTLSNLVGLFTYNINQGTLIPSQGFPGGATPGAGQGGGGGVSVGNGGGGGASVRGARAVRGANVDSSSPTAIQRAVEARNSVLNRKGMMKLD